MMNPPKESPYTLLTHENENGPKVLPISKLLATQSPTTVTYELFDIQSVIRVAIRQDY